jgi:hypothetical protein
MASTTFLFLSASSCLPCESVEAWRAALRSFTKAPVLVPPSYPGLPNRDALVHAPPPGLAPAEHSEDQRARVEGPSEGRVPSSLATISRARAGCIRIEARMLTNVPLLGALRTSAVAGAIFTAEEPLRRIRTDLGHRSDDAPRRAPPSRRPGCLLPSRHAKDCFWQSRRDCSLRPSRRLSRSRRPHLIPRKGDRVS